MRPKKNETTTNTNDAADSRRKADAALAAKLAADDAEKAAGVRRNEIRNQAQHSTTTSWEQELAQVVADRDWREAEDAARVAAAAAAAALDAADVAAGDGLALLACDAATLRDQVAAILGEEEALRTQLSEVEKRRDRHIEAARAAWTELDARRSAAGLVGPVPLPDSAPYGTPASTALARAFVAELDQRLAGAMPTVMRNAEHIRQLTNRENELRIQIELMHREQEKRRADAEEERRWREDEQRAREEERARERAKQEAELQAQETERARLIESQKRREAAAGAA